MISSWARMCKILGKDFEKYLPVVMGPVLKTASFKPEIAVVDEDEVKEISDEEDWQFVTIGDQVSFNPHKMLRGSEIRKKFSLIFFLEI